MSEDNVVEFNGITKLDLDPDRLLKAAVGQLTEVVILGFKEDGSEYFAASKADAADTIFHIERAKNGRANAVKRDSTPLKKRVNFLKRNIGQALKRGHLPPSYRHVLRYVARRRPDLFGVWADL